MSVRVILRSSTRFSPALLTPPTMASRSAAESCSGRWLDRLLPAWEWVIVRVMACILCLPLGLLLASAGGVCARPSAF
jgi:hypothetical protein